MLKALPVIKNKRLVRHLLGYGGIEGFAKLLNVFLSLILAAVLSVSDYGVLATLIALELVVTEVILLGQNTFILRHFRILELTKFEKNYSASVYITSVSAVLLIIVVAFLPIHFELMQNSNQVKVSILVLIFGIFIQVNVTLYLMYLRAAERVRHYGILRISGQVLKFTIALFLLSLLHNPLAYPYAVLVSGIIIYLAILFIRTESWQPPWLLNGKIERRLFTENLSFSLPIAIHCVVGALYSIFDRVFLAQFADIDSVAIYNFALTQGASVFFFINILALVLVPKFYDAESLSESSHKYLNAFLILSILGVLILSLVVYFILFPISLNFVSEHYRLGREILPIIALAMVANCASNYAVYKLTALKLVRVLPIFTLFSLVNSIVLNFILIPRLGILGAAYALLFSEFLYALPLNIYALYCHRIGVRR